MWGESIFAMDLNGVQSVLMAGITLMLQLCVESWGIQLMVSDPNFIFTFKRFKIYYHACPSGAQPIYYSSNVNDPVVIKNVNCYWDELRLRECPYSNYTVSHSDSSGRGAGVRCKVIKKINFATTITLSWSLGSIIILLHHIS